MRFRLDRPLRLALPFAAAAFAASSPAILATTSTTDSGPLDTAYSYVGTFGFTVGSGVAVGSNKILTAAHVNGATFTLNGTNYGVTSSVAASDLGYSNLDLRVVTVSGTLPGFYSVAAPTVGFATGPSPLVTMVGLGTTGLVNSTNTGYDEVGTFGRRAGDNYIDSRMTFDGYGSLLVSNLRGAGSAVVGGGDSGGGWFQNGRLVGITNVRLSTDGFPTYTFASGNIAYSGSAATDLTRPDAAAFLLANGVGVAPVPEPSAIAALGLGVVAVLRRKRR